MGTSVLMSIPEIDFSFTPFVIGMPPLSPPPPFFILSRTIPTTTKFYSGYFGRLKQVGQPPEQRTLRVDAEASRRFINSALAGDSVWKNAKTTDSKGAQQKRAAAGIGRSTPAGEPDGHQEAVRAARESFAIPGEKRKHAAASVQSGAGQAAAGGAAKTGSFGPVTGGSGPAAVTAAEVPRAKKAKGSDKKGSGKKPKRYHQW